MNRSMRNIIVGLGLNLFFLPVFADAEKIYKANCMMCHGFGVGGAPKFGDKNAWKPRIKKGMKTLLKNTISGVKSPGGMMPPRGGNPALTDAQLKSVIQYMLKASK